MKQRIYTALIIICVYALFIGLSIYIPIESGGRIFYDVLIVAMMIFAGYEMSKALTPSFGKPILTIIILNSILGYASFIIVTNIEWLGGKYSGGVMAFFGQLVLVFLICIVYSMVSKKTELKNILSTMFVLVYPMSIMVYMLAINYLDVNIRVTAIMIVFLVSSFTDMSAYFVGRTIGGPKLAPNISPKKTVSGACGGLIGGILASFLVYLLGSFEFMHVNLLSGDMGRNLVHFSILGVFGSVLNQLGDLIASYIKRACGTKDFSSLLPGHGGVLDRVDGMMLVAIFTFIYITVFNTFSPL